MYPGPYQAVRGCLFQVLRFNTISNNLANAATTGFKKDIVSFDKTLRARQTTDLAQGTLRETGNPLDIGLEGEGFFKVRTPMGIRYTRTGTFVLNPAGLLTTQNGDAVLGSGGPVSIQGNSVTIDVNGEIEVDGAPADTLSVVSFKRPELLQKEGGSYYVYRGDEKKDSLRPEQTSVKQGYVEESNVVVAQEVIRMLEALRTFESYQKVLQAFDEADARAVNEVGRLR